MTRCLLASACLTLLSSECLSAELRSKISWKEIQKSGRLAAGELIPGAGPEGSDCVRVVGTAGKPTTHTLLTIDNPGIRTSRYAIRGQVRYQNVKGQGYLNLWNIFPNGGRYFSRTLGAQGPLRHLEGSSEWREFVLPFFNKEGAAPPNRLILQVVFPGSGTVDLGPLRLVEYGPNEDPLLAT